MATTYNPELENALNRLNQIRQLQKQYPGRRPGGTGPTGLLSIDAKGWSDMLNEQIEAENIGRRLHSRSPLTVKSGYELGGQSSSIADQPEWWLQGEAQPQTITPDTAARIRRNLDMLPPNLRQLYAAHLLAMNKK